MNDHEHFIERFTKGFRSVYINDKRAYWESQTNGTPQTVERKRDTQREYKQFLCDPALFKTAQILKKNPSQDPIVQRQIEIAYLLMARNHADNATIDRITQLESEIQFSYNIFRPTLGEEVVSDNTLEQILLYTKDSVQAQAAWEATKNIGEEVADTIRELVRVRNGAARAQGYRDFYQQSLELREIDETYLQSVLDELEAGTNDLFAKIKEEVDLFQCGRFSISRSSLRPWHYGDRFFQKVSNKEAALQDQFFSEKKPADLAKIAYRSFGLDVSDIISRSDLFERSGKCQHAFCVNIDREGDVRTLNNLQSNHRWNETLLHELGHGVYEKYFDKSLPWLLREPPHALSTEGLANFMQSVICEPEYLTLILKIPSSLAEIGADGFSRVMRNERVVFTRWALVMINFEREMYANPDADLNSIWWDLVERYQKIRRPENRNKPDWAAKYHIALVPVYYHNYVLGYMVAAQLEHIIKSRFGGMINHTESGEWIVENFIRCGCRYDWKTHIEKATGEPLQTGHFLRSLDLDN